MDQAAVNQRRSEPRGLEKHSGSMREGNQEIREGRMCMGAEREKETGRGKK